MFSNLLKDVILILTYLKISIFGTVQNIPKTTQQKLVVQSNLTIFIIPDILLNFG